MKFRHPSHGANENAVLVVQALGSVSITTAGTQCVDEVSALLCVAWCTPLRTRYTDADSLCEWDWTVPYNISVAVCASECAFLEDACGSAVCGTLILSGILSFRPSEATHSCAGELLVSESHGTAPVKYGVRLVSEPSADVVVDISAVELVATPASLSFSPTTWAIQQQVILHGCVGALLRDLDLYGRFSR